MRSSGNSATIPGSISNTFTKPRNSTATGLSAVSLDLRENAKRYDPRRSVPGATDVGSIILPLQRIRKILSCWGNSYGTTESTCGRPHRRRGPENRGSTGRPTPLRCRGDAARGHAPSEMPRQKGRQPLQTSRVPSTAPSVAAWATPPARLRASEMPCKPPPESSVPSPNPCTVFALRAIPIYP